MSRKPGLPAPVVWITGLPASGKTTLALELKNNLRRWSDILDGDAVRRALWPELGWSREERQLNCMRVAKLTNFLACNGVVTIVSMVSPYAEDREWARNHIGGNFIEVFCSCPLKVCKARDKKGLYELNARGKLPGLTGVDDPYEVPTSPEIIYDSNKEAPRDGAVRIAKYIEEHFEEGRP